MRGGVEIRLGNFLPSASEEGALHRGTEGCGEPGVPLIVYQDPCRSRYGVLKLKLVQRYYGPAVDPFVDTIKDHYTEWRDTVELLPMRCNYKTTGTMNFKDTPVDPLKWIDSYRSSTGLMAAPFNDNSNCQLVSYEFLKSCWINKKSVKRGNDVYVDLLNKKFAPLMRSSNHMDFFSTAVNSKRKRVRRTRMLYLTGTCDPAITGDIAASWLAFGAYWNHFITCLRNRFGKVAYIRTWQSQDNWYPHFHALIYFFDFEFTATSWREHDGSTSWRIHNRQKVTINHKNNAKGYCRDVIKDLWRWGQLDIKCCDSSKSALTDLLKYVLRDLEGGASDKTNSMVWYFMKKSFAVSHAFEELFGSSVEEPTDADLINAEGVIQEATQKEELVSIDIFPLIPRDLMPYYQQLTFDELDRPPDPGPELVEFLDNFADGCVCSKSIHRDDGVVVNVFKFKEGYD